MRILKSTLALGAVLVAAVPASTLFAQDATAPTAQTEQHRAPNPQREAKHMAKTLNLSQDQEGKIEPILADRAQQMQAARADSSLTPKDRRAKVQGVRQDADGKIEAVLTDAQKQQYEQLKQQRGHKHAQGGNGANG